VDVVLPTQQDLEDALVVGAEEVETLVGPVVLHLDLADLAEKLVAVGGVVHRGDEVEVAAVLA